MTPKKAFIGESVKSSYRTVQICNTDAISEKKVLVTPYGLTADKVKYWDLLAISDVLITKLYNIS